MAYLEFAIICVLFGSNFKLMAESRQAFGAAEIGFGRVFGAGVLLVLLWMFSRPRPAIPWKQMAPLVLVSIAANGFPYVMQPFLLGSGFHHSYLAMTVAFTPLLTILVAAPMLGQRPTLRQLLGVLGGLVFIGVILLEGVERQIAVPMLALAVTVPLSYAWGNCYMRKTLQSVPALPLAALLQVICALSIGPLVLLPSAAAALHVAPPSVRENVPGSLLALAVLGVLNTGLTMWLFVRLVQQRGPLFAGMVTYVVPMIAMLWGYRDGEPITTRQIVGLCGVLAMVALVQSGAMAPVDDGETSADNADAIIEV